MKLPCKYCGELFEVQPYRYNSGNKTTCSDNCRRLRMKERAKNRRTGVKCTCALPGCNKTFYRRAHKVKQVSEKSGYFFCSKNHQIRGFLALKDFKLGRKAETRNEYRKLALFEHGSECSCCGYKDRVEMLDVHHIDSDRKNNIRENLIVLCVWCHALVTRRLAYIKNRKLIKFVKNFKRAC